MILKQAFKQFIETLLLQYKENQSIPELIEVHDLVYKLIDRYLQSSEDSLNQDLLVLDKSKSGVISIHFDAIQAMRTQMDKLKPIINDKAFQLEKLETRFSGRRKEYFEAINTNDVLTETISNLQNQITEKKELSESLISNLDNDRRDLEKRYKFILQKARNLKKYYPICDYLHSNQIETLPEAEILQILLENPSTLSDLRIKLKRIKPVNLDATVNSLQMKGLVEMDENNKLQITEQTVSDIKTVAV